MQIPTMTVLVEAGAVRNTEAIPEAEGWVVWVSYASRSGERREVLERQRGGAWASPAFRSTRPSCHETRLGGSVMLARAGAGLG